MRLLQVLGIRERWPSELRTMRGLRIHTDPECSCSYPPTYIYGSLFGIEIMRNELNPTNPA